MDWQHFFFFFVNSGKFIMNNSCMLVLTLLSRTFTNHLFGWFSVVGQGLNVMFNFLFLMSAGLDICLQPFWNPSGTDELRINLLCISESFFWPFQPVIL